MNRNTTLRREAVMYLYRQWKISMGYPPDWRGFIASPGTAERERQEDDLRRAWLDHLLLSRGKGW